jgi:hypothetical protein
VKIDPRKRKRKNKLIGRFRENGDHPYENVAKSGYILDLEYKSFINILYSWLQTENQVHKTANFSFLTFADGNQRF